jgi:hypothetical protein
MKAVSMGFGLLVGIATLSGCSSVDAFNKASNAYSAVRTGMTANAAYSSVKDLKDAQPLFQGYTSVTALVEIAPRESNAAFPETFRQNMLYLVGESVRAIGASLTTCQSATACGGRVLVVQFRETAYNGGLVERVTMGAKLKGGLSYVDLASGQIVASKASEGVDNYAGLMGLIHASISTSMLKCFPAPDAATMQRRVEAINAIPAIRPGLEESFKVS